MNERWKIRWQIDPSLLLQIKDFCKPFLQTRFVERRRIRNVEQQNIVLSNERIWKTLIICLLTSNQRSGPGKPVNRFLLKDPFPLQLAVCLYNRDQLTEFASQILSANGIWRANVIGEQLKKNLDKWEYSNWSIINLLDDYILHNADPVWERNLATMLLDKDLPTKLHGIGPKQSRNFIQILGLSKFEIPIDSTMIYWLNHWGFPIFLTSQALNDRYFYEFVNSSIIGLSNELAMYPCILDACIFTSEYGDDWPENSIIF